MDPTIESQIVEHLNQCLYKEKQKITIGEIVEKFQQKAELVNNVLEKFVKKETERKAEIHVSYMLMGYKNDDGDVKLLRFVNCDEEELEERKKFFNEVIGTQIRIISPSNDDTIELPASISNVPFSCDLDSVWREQKLTGITNKLIKLRMSRLKKVSATALKVVEKPEVKKEIMPPVDNQKDKLIKNEILHEELESDSCINKKICETRLDIKQNGSPVKISKEETFSNEDCHSSNEEECPPLKEPKQESESFTKITKRRKRIKVQFDDSDEEEIKKETVESEKPTVNDDSEEKLISDVEMKSVKKNKRESSELDETYDESKQITTNPPKKTKSEPKLAQSKSSKTKKPTNPPKKTRLITDMFFRANKPMVK